MSKTARGNAYPSITLEDKKFVIDGTATTVYSGAVHYWRLDRDKWEDIINKVKSLGFNTISIYMPWEAHEIERGQFDFGQVDPRTDLDAFLTLIDKAGLKTIARPGPQINSEMTWFGYPRRILDDPDLQALNAQGGKAVLTQVPRPIPAVSYAADKFFEETALWFDAIMPILVKHQYPKGGLVATQVDNEMAYFFHINPYACDFHPASIARFQTFLEEKYGSTEAISKAYGQRVSSFAALDAPRRFEGKAQRDLPRHVDWIEYREKYLVDCLARLGDMMKERGLNETPLFHNYPHPLGPGGAASGITAPYNLTELEKHLDFVGFDIYSRKELYSHVRTVVSYVVGTSRFPYIPEFIAGVWPWYLNPGDQNDEGFVTKAALMHGIKGFSRYMLVERDKWMGSPIRRDGRIRKENAVVFEITNAVATQYDFKDFHRHADILLMANRDYDRLEAACELLSFPGDFLESQISMSEYPNAMTVSGKTFGFDEPIQLSKTKWFNGFAEVLNEKGYTYLLSDTALGEERMVGYKAILLSSFEFLAPEVQSKLLDYVEEGGTVILGPKLPHLDTVFTACDLLKSKVLASASTPLGKDGSDLATSYAVGKGRVVLVSDLAKVSEALDASMQAIGVAPVVKNDPRIDVAIHRNSDKPDQLLVYVANPTSEPVEVVAGVGQTVKSITEIWSGETPGNSGETWSDSFAPYTIKTYAVSL
ncbi:beta-galactosidase [Cohaesibacter marisflavi]|uniref:Beta-galactosidase n=1 Tax=Cohaesibacter marisflavi TaxID=655353 RepID=A0A1I5MFE8_9HYPH|nr:beta-galactosidase [Cohaesibacter marisflavi]SFP07671.1 beta-galactosidase [Cohaesibacter marisflavi]